MLTWNTSDVTIECSISFLLYEEHCDCGCRTIASTLVSVPLGLIHHSDLEPEQASERTRESDGDTRSPRNLHEN